MIDIDSLQQSDKFRALPPERQARLLAKARARNEGGDAPPLITDDAVKPAGVMNALIGALPSAGLGMVKGGVQGALNASGVIPRILGAAKGIIPPLAKALPASLSVPEKSDPTGSAINLAATAGGALIPGAPEGATLMEKLLPMAKRLALTTGVGAAAGGKEGAKRAAATQGIGEAAAPVLGAVGKGIAQFAKESSVYNEDLRRIAKYAREAIPPLRKQLIGTSGSIIENFEGPIEDGQLSANSQAGKALRAVKGGISKRLRGRKSIVPSLGPNPMTFDEADTELQHIGKLGYRRGGDPRDALPAAIAQEQAWKGRQEIADNLNAFKPGLGDKYLEARRWFHDSESMGQLIQRTGTAGRTAPGKLNMDALQKKLIDDDGLRARFERTPGGRKMLRALFRDAPDTSQYDRPPSWTHAHGWFGSQGAHGYIDPRMLLPPHRAGVAYPSGNIPPAALPVLLNELYRTLQPGQPVQQ